MRTLILISYPLQFSVNGPLINLNVFYQYTSVTVPVCMDLSVYVCISPYISITVCPCMSVCIFVLVYLCVCSYLGMHDSVYYISMCGSACLSVCA